MTSRLRKSSVPTREKTCFHAKVQVHQLLRYNVCISYTARQVEWSCLIQHRVLIWPPLSAPALYICVMTDVFSFTRG